MILMNLKQIIRYGAGVFLFLAAGIWFLASISDKNQTAFQLSGSESRELLYDTPGSVEELQEQPDAVEDSSDTEDGKTEPNDNPAQPERERTVFVHVCGAVVSPGVYELTEGTRIAEAIGAAGGFTKEADPDALNQALTVSDGQQVYIPTVDEAAGTPALQWFQAGVRNGSAESGKVNLNTADRDELMTLPGIGSAKADSIIDYRLEHGGFSTVEDIKKISGIKDSVFNKIKDRVTVE